MIIFDINLQNKLKLLTLDYFKQNQKLSSKIQEFNGLFVRGGNIFALRQAIKLSGLDEILVEYSLSGSDFLYMGFSAGICVLARY